MKEMERTQGKAFKKMFKHLNYHSVQHTQGNRWKQEYSLQNREYNMQH